MSLSGAAIISDFLNLLFHYLNASLLFIVNLYILSGSNDNVRIRGLKSETVSQTTQITIIEQVLERV